MRVWNTQREERQSRLNAAAHLAKGKVVVAAADAQKLIEAVVRSGDRVCLEGDNQKQADFLADALAAVDPAQINNLHIVQSGVVLQAHLDLFEKGIARKLDFSYAGPQSHAIARALSAGQIELGAVHTYIELFARYFVDLTPNVALIAAVKADRDGNLYTGRTPRTRRPSWRRRPSSPASWSPRSTRSWTGSPASTSRPTWSISSSPRTRPFYVEPLFTRDPASVTETQILMAMMALKGIYAPYGVQRLNHGIGFPTAAIELILPTYGESLGLKGKVATHWALNPHPTLIRRSKAGGSSRSTRSAAKWAWTPTCRPAATSTSPATTGRCAPTA